MKRLLCALALAVLSLGHGFAAGDMVPVKNAVFTGTITVTPGDPAKPFTTVPLTIASLLKNFGPEGVKASDAAFFSSPTSATVVLASTDGATVYMTLLTLVTNEESRPAVLAKRSTKALQFSEATFLNDTFSGHVVVKATLAYGATSVSQKLNYKLSGSGSFPAGGANNAVMTGSLSGQVSISTVAMAQ
jgi:hypothetical protein